LRLYQALGNQESYDVSSVLKTVQNEKDPSALVAGLGLLAKSLNTQPSPELQSFFTQTALPQLTQIALKGLASDDRMAAVVALTQASATMPAAMDALRNLAQQSTDPRVLRSVQSYIAKLPP